MQKYEHDLITQDNTEVYHEDADQIKYNAPHHFVVADVSEVTTHPKILAEVNFQEGPTKVVGMNGVFNEDLIAMVICRLEHFQKSDFACRENAVALTKLEEALMWLRKRTLNRTKRNVLGTYNK